MPKIINFPSLSLLSKHANESTGSERYQLNSDSKREIAERLVHEAARLLKTLSDQDAAVGELLIDCLRLTSNYRQVENETASIETCR